MSDNLSFFYVARRSKSSGLVVSFLVFLIVADVISVISIAIRVKAVVLKMLRRRKLNFDKPTRKMGSSMDREVSQVALAVKAMQRRPNFRDVVHIEKLKRVREELQEKQERHRIELQKTFSHICIALIEDLYAPIRHPSLPLDSCTGH